MLSKQVVLTSAMTLACALGIGFFMQASSSRWAGEAAAAADPQLPPEPGPAELKIENITLTSRRAEPALSDAQPQSAPLAQPGACNVTAAAKAGPMAMVSLTVSAPCHGGERLTVHHSGMTFTAALDRSGHFAAQVPALTRTAVYIAETASGGGAVAVAEAPDAETVERVVLQWSGSSGLEIHAREFGAGYGSTGHVWHGAASGLSAGQVIRLGDASLLAPRIAEIYSVPSRQTGRSGTVSVTAEAEVTGQNCGRDISAQALQLSGGRLSSRDLVIAMPDCDAQGSFLVLNNLVEDLKIASN
ncbi:hypothetical protein K3718_18110 [Leisingera aquaemixtae]|uniref:Translocase n=1 Tax=Leisingera aquaemixtae TaxID=1396826 RepID=A0ABY5WIX1_9RHOB|nr:hypothetical protein [Leisingera aquaemixtae]UWQ41412.1 hypothetical protein K3718_18110 [Leisingera aquaemixtae]